MKFCTIRRFLSRAVMAMVAFSFLPSWATAQDNWAADDASLEARKLERYQQLVDQSPEKSYAFQQLMASVGKGAAYQKLLEDYEKKVAKNPKNFNLHMVLGHIYQHGGRTNEAIEAYQKALEIEKTPLVYMAIGAAEAENRNYDPAVVAYEAAAELKPNRDQKREIWRALAEIAIYRRDMERAKKCFSELIKLEPNAIFVRRELAQIYQQNRMYEEARDVLADAMKLSSASSDEKDQMAFDIAVLYEEEGNDDEALKRYEAMSEKLAASHWMQRDLNAHIVDIYRRKGNVKELAARYEKRWKSPSYQQHLELSSIYEDVGDGDKTLEHLKKAIAMTPKQPEAHEKLIRFYRIHGNLSEMFAARLNLIKQIPDNAEYRFALYDDYMAQHQLEKALGVLDEIQKKFTSQFDVQQRVAQEFLVNGRGQKALNIYESWLKKHPDQVDAYEALGDYYDANGQRKKAISVWQKIEGLSLDTSTKLETLARIYAEHNDTEEAERLYRKYVAINPKDCFILSEYAEILTTNGKIQQAIEAWENLALTCANEATMTTASRQIASLYESRGMQDKALALYRGKCETNVSSPEIFLLYAAIARALHQSSVAIPTLEARSLDERGSAEVLKALNGLYADDGQNDRARATLEKLAQRSEGDRREALIEMAELDMKSGDLQAAQEHLTMALKLNANDAQTHEKLGDVLVRRRYYEEAVNNYAAAFQIDNRLWSVAFKEATALSILGKLKEADEIYVQIVRESTDEAISQKAAQRAIDDHTWLGTLDELSREWLPLLRSSQRKALYLEILLSVAQAHVQPFVLEMKTRDSSHAVAARYALRDLSERYASLLVEAALYPDVSISNRAIALSEWLTASGLLNVLGQKIANATTSDLGRSLQLQMIRSIAHSQLPGAVPIIEPFLDNRYSRALREHTLWALGLIDAEASAKLLREALHSSLDTTRALAVIGLGRQNKNLDEIRQILRTDPSQNVRNVAAWMLANLHDDLAYPEIRKLFRDNAKKPHQLWSLVQADEENATSALLNALWCGSNEVRQMAAHLMLSTPSQVSIATLTLLEAQGRFIRETSTQYLSHFDLDMLLDHFSEIRLSEAENATPAHWLQANRTSFLEAIPQMIQKPECRANMLRDWLQTENAPRFNIADISQRAILIDAVRAIKPQLLSWMQSDTTSETRNLASLSLRALALTQDDDVLEPITTLARQSADMAVRLDAIYALSLFETPESHRALRELAADDDYLVRATAVNALNPADPDDLKVLQKAADDPYLLVAQTARQCLELSME